VQNVLRRLVVSVRKRKRTKSRVLLFCMADSLLHRVNGLLNAITLSADTVSVAATFCIADRPRR